MEGGPARLGSGGAQAQSLMPPRIELLGRADYSGTLAAMREFTLRRGVHDADRIWLCEHDAVYTLGIAGRPQHVHDARGIPIVHTERGGQVTFHGPGQVVAYPLVDLKRLGIYVKEFVHRLEHCVLQTLLAHGVTGHRVAGAPGVYVRLADPFGHAALRVSAADGFAGLGKIAALGIKVSRHCTYHGLALNVAMDLTPFSSIDPCGYTQLRVIDLATLGVRADWPAVAGELGECLAAHLAP